MEVNALIGQTPHRDTPQIKHTLIAGLRPYEVASVAHQSSAVGFLKWYGKISSAIIVAVLQSVQCICVVIS